MKIYHWNTRATSRREWKRIIEHWTQGVVVPTEKDEAA